MKYFGGLNALRVYASVSVLFGHVLYSFGDLRPPVDIDLGDMLLQVVLIEGNAVRLFFVVTGFLMTCRLLNEREQAGRISISNFYFHHALRIYPLYFTVCLVGLVLLPLAMPSAYTSINSLETMAFLSFMGNISSALENYGTVLGHLWSIAAQEQFALAWVVLMARGYSVPKAVSIILIAHVAASLLIEQSGNDALISVMGRLRFDALAMGALAAWAVHRKAPFLRVFDKAYIRYFVYFCFASLALVYVPHALNPTASSIASPIYAGLILCVVRRERHEPRWVKYSSKLTYGIYAWHFPVLYALVWAGVNESLLLHATLVATLCIAALSYYCIEKPFLTLKRRIKFIPVLT